MTPVYCTADDVAKAMSFADQNDEYGAVTFTEDTYPSKSYVEDVIRAQEDLIDNTLHRSFKVNFEKDYQTDIRGYQHDANGVYMAYWEQGGKYIHLKKHILSWDPDAKIYDDEGNEIYSGDKLEIRAYRAQRWTWVDITNLVTPNSNKSAPASFDYRSGKLYLYTRFFTPEYNSIRISYRYGSTAKVPESVKRLCVLHTMNELLATQMYNVSVPGGGDIGDITDRMIKRNEARIAQYYSALQRTGSVHSWSR